MPTYPVELLWCSNNRQGRSNGWSFPPNVRRRLEADFAGQRCLHLFGGQATFGTRIDIDPFVRPDVIADAWLPPFAADSFDVVILDPPYLRFGTQERQALFCAAGSIARKTVVWFHTIWVAGGWGLVADKAWLVRVGDSCHVRALQYFRVNRKPVPVKFFSRGPAMKYNRWLAQPQRLAFGDGSVVIGSKGE